MRIVKSLVFTVALFFGSVANANIMVWLDPAVQTDVAAGDDISLKLMISGLGNYAPVSLGGFDVDIYFDPSVLSFTDYNLFGDLGDLGLFEADDFSLGEYAAGSINLFEISYLFDFELDALQASSFALAELFFHVDALSSGESTWLSLVANNLADADGNTLTVLTGDDAVIAASQVPAPSSLALFGLSILLVLFRRFKPYLSRQPSSVYSATGQKQAFNLQMA